MSLRQRVLVPLDLSELSLEAVNAANELAQEETVVTLLHVYDPDHLKGPGGSDLTPRERGLPLQVEKGVLQKLREIRERRLDRVKTVNYEVAVSRFPAEAICEHAERSRADLLVMTSHGRSGIMNLLLGSIVSDVVRKAPCAVLLVRSSKRGSD